MCRTAQLACHTGKIAQFGSARTGKTKEGHRHRDRHVDADLADVDLALKLAREALKAGGSAPTVLNAANEVAVERFLGGEIGFLDIAIIVERALDMISPHSMTTLEDILNIDAEARRVARGMRPVSHAAE